MAGKQLKSERCCDLCGFNVGSADLGAHKRGSICDDRKRRLERGDLPLHADWTLIALVRESGILKNKNGYSDLLSGLIGRDRFAPAWVVRAVDFYRARAESYLVNRLKRGEQACEADMVSAALSGMGDQ